MTALMDERANIVDSVDIPVSVFTPEYGCVEHDPGELADSIREGAKQLMRRHPDKLEGLMGVAVANQGESFLLWDKRTKRPVTPVISWQDSRCAELTGALQTEGGMDSWFNKKTGLHLSNEWPAMKLRYMRDKDRALDALISSGCIMYGQLDAWFLYVLTDGAHHASDHSTACRSGFYNIDTMAWDDELLRFFNAQELVFPALVDNDARFEGVDIGVGKKLPWLAGGLDQSMALLGQGCTAPGSVKLTYGTCCSLWMNSGERLIPDDKLTSSVAWRANGSTIYGLAAEGGGCGSIITWLLREYKPEWDVSELSKIALDNDDQPGLMFVPAFNGIGAPYWEERAKGTMFGMTAGTRPEHILRAGLDAIAYTVRDMLDAMPPSGDIVVDGGMTANCYLMQKQADVLIRPLIKSGNREGTITGVGMLALHALGVDCGASHRGDSTVYPDIEKAGAGYAMWQKAVEASIAYYKNF